MSTKKLAGFVMKANPRTGKEARKKDNAQMGIVVTLVAKLREAGVESEALITDLVRAYERKLSERRAPLIFEIKTEALETLHCNPMFGTEAVERAPQWTGRMHRVKKRTRKTADA